MAAPIVMSAISRCGNLFRVRCSCLITKKQNLMKNESTWMLPTERFIFTISVIEPVKLCTIENKHFSLALGSLGTSVMLQLPAVTTFTTNTRDYSSSTQAVTDMELKRHMESLADSFTETRELLDDARDSFGSVYFNEDLQEAEDSLNDTLGRYAALLEKLSVSQKEHVQRSIGLKMEELKAQREVIQDIIRED